ncbi:transposable element Tcb1 transposase [Trichonephila clavipes]|nr:transposable element Tcb1 transposase [Trichonephila clavipes]
MDWPAYSPDLNPIQHVWDMLGRQIVARQPSPTCLPKFRRALLDEWCNIPQHEIYNLILSMPRRSWSDESQFQLLNADGRLRIWHQAHEAVYPTCQVGTVKSHGGSIMVWGVFHGTLWDLW